MAIWLVRAGGHGQFEQQFISEKSGYVTWDGFNPNLWKLKDRTVLQ